MSIACTIKCDLSALSVIIAPKKTISSDDDSYGNLICEPPVKVINKY